MEMAHLHAPLYDRLGLSGGMVGAGGGQSARIFINEREGANGGGGHGGGRGGDLSGDPFLWEGWGKRFRVWKVFVGGLNSCFRTGKIKVER